MLLSWIFPRDAQRVAPLKRSGLRAFFNALLGSEGREISDLWPEKGTSTERACEGTSAEGATRCASRGIFVLLVIQKIATPVLSSQISFTMSPCKSTWQIKAR